VGGECVRVGRKRRREKKGAKRGREIGTGEAGRNSQNFR